MVGYVNGEIYLDELFYETGLLNTPNPNNEANIVDRLRACNLKRTEIIADSAEQKTIHEIQNYNFNISGVKKPDVSVSFGIDLCKQQKINVTKKSVNIIKELRNYKWKTDRDGKPTNEPTKNFDHALDAFRYVIFKTFGGGTANYRLMT